MERAEVEQRLIEALRLFYEGDLLLLELDVNERTISHRIGLYVDGLFPGWNVDCEYNRDEHEPKRLLLEMDFEPEIPANPLRDTEAKTVFPDIIVHRRGTQENLLVIEMKKSSSRVSDAFDHEKLRQYKTQLGYRHAVFVRVWTRENNQRPPEVIWF